MAEFLDAIFEPLFFHIAVFDHSRRRHPCSQSSQQFAVSGDDYLEVFRPTAAQPNGPDPRTIEISRRRYSGVYR